jgi:hypothetical protein
MSGKELPKPVKTPMKLPAAEPGDDNKAVSANFHTTSLKALANQTDVPDIPALTDKEADQSSGTSGRDPISSGKPASGRDLLSSQDLAKTKRVTKSSGEADKDENMAKSHKRSRTQEASDQPQSKPQPKLQQGPDGIRYPPAVLPLAHLQARLQPPRQARLQARRQAFQRKPLLKTTW